MILKREDLPELAGPMVIFLCASFVALAVPIMSKHYLQETILEEARAEKALFDANESVRKAKEEAESLAAFEASYGALVKRGGIGDFGRLDFIENLDEAGSRLFDMQYSVSPRKHVPTSGFFSLNVNRVVLSLAVLHEVRLLDFLDTLAAKTKGIPLVEGCSMERMAGVSTVAFEPHLKAECTEMWVTLEAVK